MAEVFQQYQFDHRLVRKCNRPPATLPHPDNSIHTMVERWLAEKFVWFLLDERHLVVGEKAFGGNLSRLACYRKGVKVDDN